MGSKGVDYFFLLVLHLFDFVVFGEKGYLLNLVRAFELFLEEFTEFFLYSFCLWNPFDEDGVIGKRGGPLIVILF